MLHGAASSWARRRGQRQGIPVGTRGEAAARSHTIVLGGRESRSTDDAPDFGESLLVSKLVLLVHLARQYIRMHSACTQTASFNAELRLASCR